MLIHFIRFLQSTTIISLNSAHLLAYVMETGCALCELGGPEFLGVLYGVEKNASSADGRSVYL